MKLTKITPETLKHNRNKNILFLGHAPSYFQEFFAQYPDLKRPSAILDANPKKKGTYSLMGQEIPVCEISGLRSIDIPNTCLIITDDYYKEYFQKIDTILGSDTELEEVYFFLNRYNSVTHIKAPLP